VIEAGGFLWCREPHGPSHARLSESCGFLRMTRCTPLSVGGRAWRKKAQDEQRKIQTRRVTESVSEASSRASIGSVR
jgi:putative component of membrane protein insertase Oxa1/YidC/SpoIIIJ protein YidD